MRRLITRFWTAVDNEGVVLFQFVFGLVFIAAGLYGVFAADSQPPTAMDGAMTTMSTAIWYRLLVAGPLICLAGKLMHGDLDYAGRWMQLTGDLIVTMALLAFIAGTIQVEAWGQSAFGVFLSAGFCLCAVLMVTRDVRRLRDVERRIK